MAKKKPASITTTPSGAPTRRSCACLQSYFGLLDKYPDFRFNQANIESFTRSALRAGESAFRTGIVRIPTVVHIVYRADAENISDAQVKSQIAVLNKDFRAKNSDISKVPAPFRTLVGDTRVEFQLAKQNPQGQPTTGITRTKTTQASFGVDDDVKSPATGGIAPWDTKRYLNVWVCTLRGGLLGYAQFPGGPPDTDGVVILNTAFGTTGTAVPPFNKGRTATHEVGHYVDDTPNQFAPNTGAPAFPQISCNNSPHGDMFMNYMDYVDDAAMFLFTKGQVARMRATLAGPRKELGA